jgi:hypothetical protein
MKINCLSCGHNVDLDDAYGENYEGAIKCYGCDATLEIKTEEGSLRAVRLSVPRRSAGPEVESDRLDDHRSDDHGNGAGHNGARRSSAANIQ